MPVINRFCSIFVVLLCGGIPSLSSQPILERDARFHPLQAPLEAGMVVAQDTLAARVGSDILAQGGNAIDAAVATGFALAVTLPQAGNLGGGGFMLIYIAAEQRTYALDYREVAPAAAVETMFVNSEGRVDTALSQRSVLSTGVPGTVAGLLEAHQRFGQLSREQVLAPAIALARDGFPAPESLAHSFLQAANRFAPYAGSREYFLPRDGKPVQTGEIFVQGDLAATLERIADEGVDGFYRGHTADLIVAEMNRHQGLITHEDLHKYQVKFREPVRGSYGDYEIWSMPPPSSGGVHLVQILGLLERLDAGRYEHNSAGYLHLLVESFRYAYADRSRYLGDPDFVDVPVEKLTDSTYLDRIAAAIVEGSATPSADVLAGNYLDVESEETTHFSAWDGEGNVVSNTYTLNFSFGNHIAVSGAGFLLNNEMDDFSSAPGVPNAFGLIGDKANAIAPGKRPLSSMTPTLVMRDGELVFAAGSPGGSAIISIVAQVLMNYMEFGMNPAEAASMPRIHHQWMPDRIRWERGISADTRALMASWGHQFESQPRIWGKAESIERTGNQLHGATDPRWPSSGAASPFFTPVPD